MIPCVSDEGGYAVVSVQDYSVLFTTIPRLIIQINEARSLRLLRTLESRFEKYDLVICDEFGYISYDKNAAELLFTHLSLRAGSKSTIITINLGFDRWTEIFGDLNHCNLNLINLDQCPI
jgi:DNA replication protein DnaC